MAPWKVPIRRSHRGVSFSLVYMTEILKHFRSDDWSRFSIEKQNSLHELRAPKQEIFWQERRRRAIERNRYSNKSLGILNLFGQSACQRERRNVRSKRNEFGRRNSVKKDEEEAEEGISRVSKDLEGSRSLKERIRSEEKVKAAANESFWGRANSRTQQVSKNDIRIAIFVSLNPKSTEWKRE